jgi:hypothetical protein
MEWKLNPIILKIGMKIKPINQLHQVRNLNLKSKNVQP